MAKLLKDSTIIMPDNTEQKIATTNDVLNSKQELDNKKANKSDLGTAAYKNTGISSGQIPVLDKNNKLDTRILPALAITETYVANSKTEMLALIAEEGDVCIRKDLNRSFILTKEPATDINNWQELLTPDCKVQSVNGKIGAVELNKADVGLELGRNIHLSTINPVSTDGKNGDIWIKYKA